MEGQRTFPAPARPGLVRSGPIVALSLTPKLVGCRRFWEGPNIGWRRVAGENEAAGAAAAAAWGSE